MAFGGKDMISYIQHGSFRESIAYGRLNLDRLVEANIWSRDVDQKETFWHIDILHCIARKHNAEPLG